MATVQRQNAAEPAGPTSNGNGLGSRDRNEDYEKEIFSYLLKPDDSYNPEGIYWADLPLGRRFAFVGKVDGQETRNELAAIGRMFRNDPLSPFGWYTRNAIIPGAGLLLEGYVLFSIGLLQSLFGAVWPTCWGTSKGNPTACNPNWIAAVTYLEIVGIMVGQISVGIIGDWLGRRWGLIQDATIMFIGLLMLTASWGTTLEGWIICYAWSLFFYSVGVGGEYPMTATAAMENAVGAGRVSTRGDRLHRGRNVTMAFLMQGWGQFLNQVVLIILLLIFHHGQGAPPYDVVMAQWTYRVSFAIPAVGTLWLVYYRAYKMPLASRQLALAKKKAKVTGYDVQSLKLTFSYFGSRVIATAGCWFCNDVFFYGNKLFQSQFIAAIDPGDTSVLTGWLWNLCNIGVSLVGYYMASFLIDNKIYGRRWMMQVGFLMDFIFFVIPAFHLKYYQSLPHIKEFQTMYFLSSFFNQFGPNAVTFLVAAECYPTPIRATAHGFSAAVGKLGALFAAVIYSYVTVTQTRYYIVPWFGLIGMLLTFFFLPDTTGLDLREQERRWKYIREGREHDYHGVAIHPKHLSVYERFRGVSKHYDPQLDFQSKMADMREDWEIRQAEKAESEKLGGHVEDDDEYSDDVHRYFQQTPSTNGQFREKAPKDSDFHDEVYEPQLS